LLVFCDPPRGSCSPRGPYCPTASCSQGAEAVREAIAERIRPRGSRAAVEVVVADIKQRLPEPIAGQLDHLIDKDDDGDGDGGVMGMVKGYF